MESPPTSDVSGQRQVFRGKERPGFKRGGVKSQRYAWVQLQNFLLGVPPSVPKVASSAPANLTLIDTGPLNRRLAVRGPGAGAGDRQQRPAPGRWRLGMREASTRTGPSLLALSNIGTGCEITWVLRNRPPASSHLPPWDLTPRTKHLMMTQHTPKKVKQRKRKKNQKATRPHVFPGEWCTLNAEVTSWR